jgi:hypothetical protein
MKIASKNTTVLTSSLKFNEDNTSVTYQANTDLYVEGNSYGDLFTPKTIFNLTCLVSEIANINTVTQTQVDLWVEENYPEIIISKEMI